MTVAARKHFLSPIAFVASPEASSRTWSVEESLGYTQWLATNHYENFQVVSFLLPKRLHQDFYNVYAFCRWADDLGDETGNTQESLRLLAQPARQGADRKDEGKLIPSRLRLGREPTWPNCTSTTRR